MKTKAIKRCIDNGSDVRDALEAQVELYAIEEKNTMKDKALKSAIDAISLLPEDVFGSVPSTSIEQGWWIRDELIAKLTAAI